MNLIDFHEISDLDIWEILLKTDSNGKNVLPIHSESSDAARRAILKLYTYESPLYKAVNYAAQCKDERAIPTLGPYAWLLFCAVTFPPLKNRKTQA